MSVRSMHVDLRKRCADAASRDYLPSGRSIRRDSGRVNRWRCRKGRSFRIRRQDENRFVERFLGSERRHTGWSLLLRRWAELHSYDFRDEPTGRLRRTRSPPPCQPFRPTRASRPTSPLGARVPEGRSRARSRSDPGAAAGASAPGSGPNPRRSSSALDSSRRHPAAAAPERAHAAAPFPSRDRITCSSSAARSSYSRTFASFTSS